MSSPQDTVRVEASIPAWMLRAAGDKFPHDSPSDLIRRGLALLAIMDPPVKVGRHERKDTP